MTYKEQLRDPRWQRVKSRIQIRDNFKCRFCGDSTSFLNVHHLFYTSGKKVWEYDDESLITLCESCHTVAHESLPKIISMMSISIIRDGACLFDIEKAVRKITNTTINEKTLF